MANVTINSIRNERDLEIFIREHIQTDDAYRTVCKRVIKSISEFLKHNIQGKYRPEEVLKVRLKSDKWQDKKKWLRTIT